MDSAAESLAVGSLDREDDRPEDRPAPPPDALDLSAEDRLLKEIIRKYRQRWREISDLMERERRERRDVRPEPEAGPPPDEA
jgi:hypothetical protein